MKRSAAPGATGEATGAFTLTVNLPPYRLGPNGTRNWEERARLTRTARAQAVVAALGLPPGDRPLWPTGRVRVDARVVLPTGWRRLDDDNAKALLKPTWDGLQGFVVANDRQFVWGALDWERNPSAISATVTLTFTPAEAP